MAHTVLITDDERMVRWYVADKLRRQGLVTLEARDGCECLQLAPRADAVLLDYRLPDRSGFEVLRELHRMRPSLPVIILTGYASVDHAIEAMKLGAYDYLAKPCPIERIVALIDCALERDQDQRGARITSQSLDGSSVAVRRVRHAITSVAVSSASAVLITGESGTGKDLAARALHGESKRWNEPFAKVACNDFPDRALDFELFGYEKDAFPGAREQRIGRIEATRGGTLVLDEIAETSRATQHKLLRLIQHRSFRRLGGRDELRSDVRVIVTANADLERAVSAGRFLRELYHRLCVVQIRIPALRERLEDLALLIESFLDRLRPQLDPPMRITEDALRAARERTWPCNLRELEGAVHRAAMLSPRDSLEASDFALEAVVPSLPKMLPRNGLDMVELQRTLVLQALERSHGNQRVAGEMIGMNRDQVRYRMAKFGIPSRRRQTEQSP